VLRFVRDHGPLDFEQSWATEPQASGALRLERSMSVRYFIARAVELAEAVRFAALDEPYPRWLNDVMNNHLRGVHPVSFNAEDLGTERGIYGFTCDSLLSAMWWQFYEADAGGGAWRQCKGCRWIFKQGRSDQEYHTAACRNRANVRNTEIRRKQAQRRAKGRKNR
jgi:hypothetical protein